MYLDSRPLLRWLGAGVLTATLLWTVAGGLVTLVSDGTRGVVESLPLVPMVVITGFVGSILACGVYAPVLAQWPRLVAKWPAVERSWLGLLVATGVLALPPTLIAPQLAATFALGSSDYFRELVPWSITIGLTSWGGLFLPRLLIPGLRLGAMMESRSLTSA